MNTSGDHDPLVEELASLVSRDSVVRQGVVTEVQGPIIRAEVPEASMGELMAIERPGCPPLLAEVVGFDRAGSLLMALGEADGLRSQAVVRPVDGTLTVPCGPAVVGRVLDALGRPMDGGPDLDHAPRTPMMALPPVPTTRAPVDTPISTGIRAIDGLLTIGRGQRVGIFAAAGVGKSTLLGIIARRVEADLIVVALIGERGREVNDFLRSVLGEEGRRRAVVVVSTSDQPAMLRVKAAHAATAIAEEARSRGKNVVLMMDSVTRFARGLREAGLAAGEPPGRQGFPASVYAALPKLFERAGNDDRGSITAFYTVLVAGDDLQEPISDETISLLDGHIVMSKQGAEGRLPAIDVSESVSRLREHLLSEADQELVGWAVRCIQHRKANLDKIQLGIYKHDRRFTNLPDPEAAHKHFFNYLDQRSPDRAGSVIDSLQLLRKLREQLSS